MALDIRDFVNREFRFKQAREILDRLESLKQKVEDSEKIWSKIQKELRECTHPVVKKLIDFGQIGRKESSGKLKQVIGECLSKNSFTGEDIRRVQDAIDEYKQGLIQGIQKQVSGTTCDIRPIHIPGSVSCGEARNLYFGFYQTDVLLELGKHTLNSICIGPNIAVYFFDDELMGLLRFFASRKFGEHHILKRENLMRIKISLLEENQPYIVLTKFILWMSEFLDQVIEEEERNLCEKILRLLRQTEGVIYVTPGNEKVKYTTLQLPNLDFFFSHWIEKKERRMVLLEARNSLFDFLLELTRVEKESKRVEVIVSAYENLCENLLKRACVAYESLNKIVCHVLELSAQHNIPVSLTFVSRLTEL
jgi:hypothetical protein